MCNDYLSTNFLYYLATLMETRYPPPYALLRVTWGATVLRTPLVIIPTRLHKASAYYIIWVVMKMALCFWHFARTYQSCLRFYGSSPVEGSSKNTIFGSPTKLIATDSLLFIPPERDELGKSLNYVSLTSSMALLTFLSIYFRGIPFSLA